jgi:allantoin racemase
VTRPRILIVNPAANPEMTDRIDRTADPFRRREGIEIVSQTVPGGPPLVASSADVDLAAVALRAHLSGEKADVFVIACYADPGLNACRELNATPVLGVGRCAALAALAISDNFGVIALSKSAIPRHLRALRQSGLDRHLAGERALPSGGASEEAMLERLKQAGRALRDEDGAGAAIIGCAEFGALRRRLEWELGIPVIDPVEAALGLAMTIIARA